MNRWEKSIILGVSGLMLAASVQAETPAPRAYRTIVDRNPFGLKDPVVETKPVVDPTANERVKINLTGITRIGNTKQVHLMIPPDGKNPPRYLSLAENDKDGAIEVLEIDIEKETVKIRNAGSEANLNFLNDGLKTAAVAAPVPPGGVAGKPMAMAPGGVRPSGGAAAGPTIVSRGGQVVNQNPNPGMSPNGQVGQPGVTDNTTSLRTIPTRNVRTQPTPSPEQVNYPDQGEDIAAKQAINMEIQRNLPTPDNVPLPPTPGLDGE